MQILVIKRPGHANLTDFRPAYLGDRPYNEFSLAPTEKGIFFNFMGFGLFNFYVAVVYFRSIVCYNWLH